MYIVNKMPEQISREVLTELSETDPGTIGHFIDAGIMDPGIQGRMLGARIVGTAVTIRVTVPDSVIGHYALKFARPGDILVVERGQDQRTACYGGSSALGAARAGVAGLIIDGVANDISEANAAGLPIWCRGVTPLTTKYRNLGGALNVTVSCGGVSVNPGDVIMADENGVIVIPRSDVDHILAATRAFRKKEEGFRAAMRDNPDTPLPDLSGASKFVEDYLALHPDRIS